MKHIITEARTAPLLRRLAAMVYDILLVCACWIVLGFVFIALNKGEVIEKKSLLFYGLQLAMLVVCAGFYVYFWVSQGQTLGMRAWRLVMTNLKGRPATTWSAISRWVLAIITCIPFGFGLWWQLFDREKRTLYDILSKTRLYVVKKNPYRND